jgi:hypothetical protein
MSDEDKHLTRMEKIQILSMEYNTLRKEVFDQSTFTYQAYGVAGGASITIIGFVFTQTRSLAIILGFVLGLLLIAAVVIYVVSCMMYYVAHEVGPHLVKLEEEINALAESELLTWEHTRGIMSGSDQRRIAAVKNPIKNLFGRNRNSN